MIAAAVCTVSMSAEPPEARFVRSTPEAEGVPSAAILSLVNELESRVDAVHSLMIVRHGRVIAEGWWSPYAAQEPHVLYSLSKSFTSTAVGLAIAEGKLRLEDPVLKFFPDEAPAQPSENLKAMSVRDLLMMSTGQHAEDIDRVDFFGPVPATKQFLAMPVPHKPGTLFYYNTAASYVLSAIVQRVSGQTTLDYLRPRLFAPLGIQDPVWQTSPQGISLGGFGLSLRTEDIASFGQLYLQRGEWKGKRILPAAWVDLATSRQASNGSNPDSDWDQGYGFQFWRCRHGFYRGDGAFGQFCIVMPEHDTVIAITSGTSDMASVMNVLWERLLPELRPVALPADDASVAQLRQKLASLSLPTVQGTAKAAPADALAKTYKFSGNPLQLEALRLEPTPDGYTIHATISGQSVALPCGAGVWRRGGSLSQMGTSEPVAGCGAWTADGTFSAKLVLCRTPFVHLATLRFVDGKLNVRVQANVAFGKNEPVEVSGSPEN